MSPSDKSHLMASTPSDDGLISSDTRDLTLAGQVANQHAARGVYADYLARKADNTIRRQAADLNRFAHFLNEVGEQAGLSLGTVLAEFAQAIAAFPDGSDPEAEAWRGVTWGLVEGFRNWMVGQGDAVGSINVRLSTLKAYAKLAAKAGVIGAEEHAMIRTVAGYAHKEGRRIDERRDQTQCGDKKAQHVSISKAQAKKLRSQPDTPQGRRDALLMCLLLDHGLRVGEVARLQVSDFDLKAGEMHFYRPKVDKLQTHKLTALEDWLAVRGTAAGPLLWPINKGGSLMPRRMTSQAVYNVMQKRGQEAGVSNFSPHDFRRTYAGDLLDAGADIVTVAQLMGHADVTTTARYDRRPAETRRKAANLRHTPYTGRRQKSNEGG